MSCRRGALEVFLLINVAALTGGGGQERCNVTAVHAGSTLWTSRIAYSAIQHVNATDHSRLKSYNTTTGQIVIARDQTNASSFFVAVICPFTN